MIIPIRAPANNADDESTEKVEWVMLELNGELLKPLDEENRREETIINNEEDIKRRVELGVVKFDSDVSCVVSCLFETICITKHRLYRLVDIPHNLYFIVVRAHFILLFVCTHMYRDIAGCTNIDNWKSRTEGICNQTERTICRS